MRYARPVMTAATLVAAVACHGGAAHPPTAAPAPAAAPRAAEPHLANIRQLTHGGENAEAYFSTRRQAADLSEHARRPELRSAVRHERRRLGAAAHLRRHRQDDVRLLLRVQHEGLLLHPRAPPTPPARKSPIRRRATCGASTSSTSIPRTRMAAARSASRATTSTRPKARCRPTGRRSCSRRSRMAISTSTR